MQSSSQGSSFPESSMVSQQPMSPTSRNHIGDKPSTSKNKVPGKREKVKFSCKLCMGDNFTHHCPRKDEASNLLGSSIIA